MQYAREHHFPNPTFFVDDGVSGVTYDRPGFQAMLAEIEAGRVAVAIAKDLSRLGRNSALTGLYTNFTFPQNGVRFIAINDNYDTIDPMPTTPEGKAKLSKELTKFHAEQALKIVQKLPCSTEQKLELIDAVVEHLRSKQ